MKPVNAIVLYEKKKITAFYSPSQLLKRKGQVLHPIVPLFGASKPNQDAFARDLSDVPGAERYRVRWSEDRRGERER